MGPRSVVAVPTSTSAVGCILGCAQRCWNLLRQIHVVVLNIIAAMKTILSVTFTVALFCLTPSGAAAKEFAQPRMNVLFIAVDDLRPELGCYGFSQIKSPNIDELANKGLRFERAYCQYALCNPSRSSLLTGLRPETIQIYDLEVFVRTHMPDVVTLPQLFKQNGYESRSIGKIFHVTNGNHEDDISWSTHDWQSPMDDQPQAKAKKAAAKPALAPGEDFDPNAKTTVQPKVKQQASAGRMKSGRRKVGAEPYEPRADMLPYQSPDVADNGLLDGQIADKAVSVMNEIKDKPFFLAVGFHKPHMPWVAPKRYWDMYRDDDIHLAEYQELPAGAPRSPATRLASSAATRASRKRARSQRACNAKPSTATTPASATRMPKSAAFSPSSIASTSARTPSSSFGATTGTSWASTARGTSAPTGRWRPECRLSSASRVSSKQVRRHRRSSSSWTCTRRSLSSAASRRPPDSKAAASCRS